MIFPVLLSISIYIYVIPFEPPQGRVAGDVRVPAMLEKGNGSQGKIDREYWSGDLGGNIRISLSITAYYGRLWYGERTNFCIYLFGSVTF
jgi:hypothetical protein